MKYELSKTTPPALPTLGNGTESIQLLLSQVSKDIQQPIVSMHFPVLGTHVSSAKSCIQTEVGRECAELRVKSAVRVQRSPCLKLHEKKPESAAIARYRMLSHTIARPPPPDVVTLHREKKNHKSRTHPEGLVCAESLQQTNPHFHT